MTATIGALSPWFGSKRTLAPRIIEALGPHTAYWEPFCGSMAVLLAKEPCRMETVNDLHGDLTNLATVVQDEILSVELFRMLSKTACSEEIFMECAERIRHAGVERPRRYLQRAYDFFICSWLGKNGIQGTTRKHGFGKRFTQNGGAQAKRFMSAVKSIPDWWERLRNVSILCGDGFELLEKIEDAQGVAIYCDPPYLVKGAKYVHDFDDVDHERLAKALGRFEKTRVVVSYYDDPRLSDLYPGWEIERIEVTKAMSNQTKRDQSGPTKAVEVLLTNGGRNG